MNTITYENNNLDTQPWYKQFWPWFLISLPLSAVIAGIATIIIAMHKPDGLVVDDYYKQGLGINREIASEQLAQQLNISAQLDFSGDTFSLTLKGKIPLPEKITVQLIHPTIAGQDRLIPMQLNNNNIYQGRIKSLTPVNWHIRITPEKDHWRLSGRFNPAQTSQLKLGAF